jgi:SAM-dependent methyltransferase
MSEKHYYEQKAFAQTYLIPYFQKHVSDFQSIKILEIGCAEAGVLAVLAENGMDVCGLELEAGRIKIAKAKNPQLTIYNGDITDPAIIKTINRCFDLIILRDVIEHITDRNTALTHMIALLKARGYLFITFPPRFSGFAGHQQNARSFLRFMPFLHLLPNCLIRFLGYYLKENKDLIEDVITNYRIGLTVHAFEGYCKQYKLKPVVRDLFLIRPVFKLRYNLRPRKMFHFPFVREMLASGCEYLLQKGS